jgi:gamma-glutamyltranspeptidase/glutathione hydrolase
MIASNAREASEAGVEILRAGGNAVDAAVATGFALAVTYPVAGNIGGGGFMVIHLADGRQAAVDYRETAPLAATRNMYLDASGEPTDRSQIGHLAVGVPGAVAGMAEALARFGTLPLATVMAPAIRLAEEGFAADSALSGRCAATRRRTCGSPARRCSTRAGGRCSPARGSCSATSRARSAASPSAGRRSSTPASRRLARRRDAPRRRAHHAAGPARLPPRVARAAAGHLPRPHGARDAAVVERRDLGHRAAERARPVAVAPAVRQRRLPPPAGGGLPARLRRPEHAARRPGVRPRPGRGAHERGVRAPPRRRHRPRPRHADPRAAAAGGGALREGNETTHYSVVDAAGNAVATTTTINELYGAGVYVAGAGFFLNDEMDDLAAAPGRPNAFGLVEGEQNAVAPGKRPLSSMTPTVVLDTAGRVLLVVGAAGGPTIISGTTQVILNVLDHRMTLADAMRAPRLHHQALPDELFHEANGLSPRRGTRCARWATPSATPGAWST